MKERRKVLYISQEITPYLPASPMASVGKNLPQSTQENGYEVRTFMPKYGCINERRNQLHEVIRLSGMNVVIDDTDHPLIIKVATLQPSRMQVYFIDNDDYFQFSPDKRLEIVSSPDDNDERIMFFSRGVIETVRKLRWNPAIIHCLGWASALTPLFVKKLFADDPTFAESKIVYAIREESFDGTLDERFADKLLTSSIVADDIKSVSEGPVDFTALNKLAIDHADALVFSSAKVAPELQEYARNSGKPLLEFTDDETEFYKNYMDFYESIVG
ncbi:MAG: glycogen/starch synthase [Bacteroides sp.]|nr:glycogen/starch synthase [Bacteroides sp.]